MTGAQNPCLYLGSVIGLPVIIFLNDNERNRLHLLISCKTLVTLVADTSSSNGIILLRRSAVDHSCILMAAIGAFHQGYPPRYQ